VKDGPRDRPLLEALDGIAYLTDREGTILAAGRHGWSSFAAENGAPQLSVESVVGSSMFSHMAGDAVLKAYRDMHAAVWSGQKPRIGFRWRCDSPDVRRDMHMSISMAVGHAGHSAALYQSQVVTAERRPAMDLLSRSIQRTDPQGATASPEVLVCCWCHGVAPASQPAADGGRWTSLEDFCARGVPAGARVFQGICPACRERILDPNVPGGGSLPCAGADRAGAGLNGLEFQPVPSGVRRWLNGLGRAAQKGARDASRIGEAPAPSPAHTAEVASQGSIPAAADISRRDAAEEVASQGEQRFRSLFEGAPLPIYLIDPADASIVDCNAAASAMLGFSRDDLRHMRVTDIDPLMSADDLASKQSTLLGQPIQFETRHRTRSGEIRDVRIAAVPVDITGRRLTHATVVDITERKRAEAGLQDLTANLERRVGEEVTAREAAHMLAAQAERLQALGLLAGGIAHDFNNVLQAVQGSAAMIGRRPGNLEAVNRYVGIVLEAADRGASITRRLLALARRGDLRAEAIGPQAILEGIRDILVPTLGPAVRIVTDVDADLPQMMADRGQMETALVNLATNARDAMPQGGTLTLAAHAELVVEDCQHPAHLAPGCYLRITVADTGVGMSVAALGHIFEPFFTTKAKGLGTGLGLAMVKGFAEQSGGGVAVESHDGHGTKVSMWLPQAVDAVPTAAEAVLANPVTALPVPATPVTVPDGGTPGSCVRVLAVDDDPLVLEAVAAHLEYDGFSVITASGGAQALALLDDGIEVHALVSDLSMPGMDGMSLILEAQSRIPSLPAILLTGYAGDGVSLAMGRRARGPFALMRKPCTGSDLTARISALLAEPARLEA